MTSVALKELRVELGVYCKAHSLVVIGEIRSALICYVDDEKFSPGGPGAICQRRDASGQCWKKATRKIAVHFLERRKVCGHANQSNVQS